MALFRRKLSPDPTDYLDKRLADIDRRLSELGEPDPDADPFRARSYQQQEADSERTSLKRYRAETLALIEERDRPKPPTVATDQERRRAACEAAIREAEENCDRQAERMASQGDFRQSRIWRMERYKVRERVEREWRLVPAEQLRVRAIG